ncbi:helix-turn-helix domain-containing protein [Frigidibacter sp.]|uniref:helix-turn-helix domain-containing protein n=1 Tax=Frigidibacter sp. TaxID=2586418 RepID=UPI002737018D|nr:helix-turn-helix domain-containing protein [Frigidibacter sp.]MDP3338782.1 helix-turn-helix domain-containing protein [Frigidibacter sp.]
MIDSAHVIPAWQLYGEDSPFPDLLHIERIVDRAAGLDWRIAPHRHVHLHQMFLIRSGRARLTIDGAAQDMACPAVANIPRGVVHGFAFSAGTDGYVLTLPAADFPELFVDPAETAPLLARAFIAPAPEDMQAPFAQLAALHHGPGALRRLRLRAGAVSLCCTLAELAPHAPGTHTPGDPRIARFEALIRRELASGWTLGDYAHALAISERQLRRLCTGQTGLSAHGFLETIRLREACRMLAYTRMQVQEVGFALGFDDPAYFTRTFRRGMGLAPGLYRKRLDGVG